MAELPIVHVDAFTDRPFSGNAAAVVLLQGVRDKEWMQRLAQETNLAATVFLWPQHKGEHPEAGCYHIRWFTPHHELPLCGHGTLAAAHMLWTEGHVDGNDLLTLYAERHTLTATRNNTWITLDFPLIPTVPADAPDALRQGLGTEWKHVRKSHHSYLVELASEAEVSALAPDIALLARLDTPQVIVTSRAEEGRDYDFVSRFFAPGHGIAEDPVTGSAHCCLAPFWGERLGKAEMVGYQASSRGGVVRVTNNGERVGLSGQAVTVSRGALVGEVVQEN